MRLLLSLCLGFLFACARAPVREPAGWEFEPQWGAFVTERSSAKQFAPVYGEESIKHVFSLELRDEFNLFVDYLPEEFSVRDGAGKAVAFEVRRELPGRYFVMVEQKLQLHLEQDLEILVAGRAVSDKFKLHIERPESTGTSLRIVHQQDHKVRFRLTLGNAKGRHIASVNTPEIILDGNEQALIEDLTQVRRGVWEFTLVHPDENQLIYLSVRAQGAYFKNLFRFQHIEN
jgi:hypothetical protein